MTAVVDEAVVGDFSNVGSSPTLVRLQPGSTSIRGSTGPGPGGSVDVDYFTVVVPADESLTNVYLREYWQRAMTVNELPGRLGDQGAFLALTGGGTSANEANYEDRMMGALLVGVMPEANVGNDVLAALGEDSSYVVPSFALPLPAGEYTFWYQQNRVGAQGATSYDFEFIVTPLPGALPLLATGALGLAMWARRRGRAA